MCTVPSQPSRARASFQRTTSHRLSKEAEIHFAMRHANIVEVLAFSIGDKQHPPCLVMERMDESLYDILTVLTINFSSALGIIQDVCEVNDGCGVM